MAEQGEKKKDYKGLRRLRNSDEKKPIHHCDNCGCDRYSPCRCQRKGDR